MAATNFILEVHAALWALIDAHAPTAGALRVNNAIRQNRRTPDTLAKSAKQPADFPRVYLRAKGITGTAFSENQSLATMAGDYDPATCGGDESIVQTFELEIIHEACVLDKNSLFELELLTALRKGGPKFGFTQVAGWSYTSARNEEQSEKTGGVLREVATFTIPVRLIYPLSELVT